MFLQRLIWLAIFIGQSLAARRMDICREPTSSCGPVPPTLPASFIMKGSTLDLNTTDLSWFEEYFDPQNLRGKYVEVSEGMEMNWIFNYHTEQIVSYFTLHPGATPKKDAVESLTCIVQDMEDSQFTSLLGIRKYGYYDQLRPRMYDSYQSLRYGGPYTYSYDETDQLDRDRQVPCKTFLGCVYDEDEDATYSMTFVWLADTMTPAFGALSMPLRILEKGGYYTFNGSPSPIWNQYNTDKSIAWFQANPYMDDDIFQIPERMECRHLRSSDPVTPPSMPNAFSTRMESFVSINNWTNEVVKIARDVYQELWYDGGNKLIRHDHLLSELEALISLETFDKESMITTVHDFNTGLSFYTDKVQGLCISSSIFYKGDSIILSDQSTENNSIMASPQEILSIDASLKFKGTYKVRDMKCSGFSARVNKTAKGSNGLVSLLHEIYSTTEGWHQDIDGEEDFEVPVKDIQILTGLMDGQDVETTIETNYYKFEPRPPPLSVYDISACAINMKKMYFKVDLKVTKNPEEMTDIEVINEYRTSFMNNAQMALTIGADLGSPLRIQDLKLVQKEDGSLGLTFTMLDLFDLSITVPTPMRGQELDKAKDSLLLKINTGNGVFAIVTDLMRRWEVEFLLVPKSLEEVKKRVTYEELSNLSSPPPVKSPNESTKGYTNGELAGLAVGMTILGLVLGTVLMLLYFKRFMRPRTATETANFELSQST